ncbi:Pentatricopeptide repeat [Trema orientale]|uniref:Pentatricopeptide repeat n=1 Tax=Trema orientale TaxID=63057 RepID=A0A2P5FEX5_TREOI|nr:Pentatricopeptide repeat [Trema orientale]
MCVSVRTPRWVSSRRLFEQKLAELHKCSNLSHVKQVHAQIIRANLHRDLYVVPKLIAALSLCRQLALAVNVFEQVQEPNVHLYNTMIRAHIQNKQTSQAFDTFFDLQSNGVFPDNFTYSFLLKACFGKTWLPVVQMIHAHIEKFGFCSDIFVPNSLIDCYCKCGALGVSAAKKVFAVMGVRDTVSWNSMIGGLVKVGELGQARHLFDEMPERDVVTWNTMLDGYAKARQMNEAFQFFQIMPERNVVAWSIMLSGYSKAGDMDMARMLFDKMPVKNLITWTIMIAGYAEKGLAKEATKLYDQMEEVGLKPDDGTIISVLAGCAESGLLGLGEKIHASIGRSGYKCSTQVSNALVDIKVGNHSSITWFNFPILGCLPESSSSSSSPPDDDKRPLIDSDWRSFRAKLVAGQHLLRPQDKEPSSSVDLDTVADPPPSITIGDRWAHTIHEPEKGCLLIATEKLDGVHIFERTVILLLSTGPLGPSGIILNRPSLMSIKETRSTALDIAGTFSDRPLFFGGPLEEGLFLVSPKGGGGGDDVVGKSGVFDEVLKGLYYGTKESVGCAAEMVKRNMVGLGEFRFFDGYCGWEREQLRDEIRAGYWTVAACSPSVIGLSSVGSVGLWEEVLGLMGPRKVW